MPINGPHLPAIEKIIHARLRELELTPQYVFRAAQHQERFYTAPCRTRAGQQVVFKMRTEDFRETQEYFRREIMINRRFSEFSSQAQTLSVPLFLAGDAETVPEWMVYEFIAGVEAGDFYNGFQKKLVPRFSVDSLIAGMRSMHALPAFAQGDIRLAPARYADFAAAYEAHQAQLAPFFTPSQLAAGRELLAVHEQLLDESGRVIAHGDFHPGNLLLQPGGEVAFIDWYNVHLNNPAFDLAFLLLEIPEHDFRDRILERFVGELVGNGGAEEFWLLLRLDIVALVGQKVKVMHDAFDLERPTPADYRTRLTPRGYAKLQVSLDFFRRALAGANFLG